ncbi:hypothetical protein ES705_21189 [subsurface metagenome]
MNSEKTIILLKVVLTIGLSGIFLISCKNEPMNGMFIFTQVSVDPDSYREDNMDYRTGRAWRYFPRARIVAVNPHKPAGSLIVLTEDFYSARSPEVSFDGKRLLFAAQQKEYEPWQIWEMDLDNLAGKQVTAFQENCTYPAYLPGGRLVFSKSSPDNSTGSGHALYTCNLDGSDVKQITFHPHADFASTVLQDGRILMISRQLYPGPGDPMFLVMRPDGTKAELFYKGQEGSSLNSRGWETGDGQVLFIESEKSNSEGWKVVAVNQNRPLHSRINLTSEIKGQFYSVFPLPSGKLLVSYRPSGTDRYALYEFDPKEKVLGRLIYNDPEYHAMEPVMVAKHTRPRNLPSEVDENKRTGLLFCQNINVSALPVKGNMSSSMKAGKVQVLGIEKKLGEVQVEEDGSFYLKIIADTPIQLQTIDENGQVVNGPSAWIWLRPNERRGCVGCHEDHELAPENLVSLSVKKPPVSIPAELSEVTEKENP